MNITYKTEKTENFQMVLKLYEDAGWINYTNNQEMLLGAIENSLYTLYAWDDQELIGILRIVGDGYSIIYIQDIIVKKEYQNKGIGSSMFTMAMERYKKVYQKILLTDDQEKTMAFYKKNGFHPADEYGCVSFVSFNP